MSYREEMSKLIKICIIGILTIGNIFLLCDKFSWIILNVLFRIKWDLVSLEDGNCIEILLAISDIFC